MRRTPMMDLLIHIATANKINPAGHIVQVRNERGIEMPYKPSTPIGSYHKPYCTHLIKMLYFFGKKIKYAFHYLCIAATCIVFLKKCIIYCL